ncbi:hypothetical protein, partial [Proteus mirabilis]|uniref:hypothetical protein n=1 Tax=Proteus mirabilis TaxID=584 RepID=UPI001952C678
RYLRPAFSVLVGRFVSAGSFGEAACHCRSMRAQGGNPSRSGARGGGKVAIRGLAGARLSPFAMAPRIQGAIETTGMA